MVNEVMAFLDDMPYFWEVLLTAITWIITLIFVRFNNRLFSRVNDELAAVEVEDRSIKAIDQMVDLFAIAIAVFITLYIWGVDEMIYAALTAIGVVGVMLGFAVKDIASNFISGILLILSKDILVGDIIEVKGIEGTVEKITVRTTSIRQYNGSVVIVPNSLILNNPVVDYSATDKRQVEVLVNLSSDVDIAAASEALREVGEKEPRCLEDEAVTVFIKGFEASTIKFQLRFWVRSEDLTSAKSDVHGEIREALAKRSIVQNLTTTVMTGGGSP